MFLPKVKSTLWWFNGHSFEEPMKFELIGILWGLAIYNSILIEIKFPQIIYKKLLKEPLTLKDLEEIEPEIYKNLISL